MLGSTIRNVSIGVPCADARANLDTVSTCFAYRTAAGFAMSAVFALATLHCAPQAIAPPPSSTTARAAAVDPTGAWQVRWDRTFAGWQPAIFSGKLVIRRNADAWDAHLQFRESSWRPKLQSLRVDGDVLEMSFLVREGQRDEVLQVVGHLRADRFIGEMRGGPIAWTPISGRRIVPTRLVASTVSHSMPSGDAASLGLDLERLRALASHAADEHSSALIVAREGRIVLEQYREGHDGGPIMAMSATKSVVALAIGMLIADRKLTLATTIESLLPEWKSLGAKGAITVRQLLNHTSGLETKRGSEASQTIRARFAAAQLVSPPGTRFRYNNAAVDTLALVVERAAGKPLDAFLDERLFTKLDAVGVSWKKDPEGVPLAAGELILRPADLAKIGQLVLDHGQWRGEQLVPREWIDEMTSAGQPFVEDSGLLWWRNGGAGKPRSFAARGWLGQHLVVVPDTKIVAVRMREAKASDVPDAPETDDYADFASDVGALVQ